jgi:pimeloyl-ACP methyl ester carboxylesterase
MPYFKTNGYRLYYREQGSGPLLLILPGNTASSAWHKGELEHFGQRFHAVSLDFCGTGRSERLHPWPLDWWEQGARDALALISHLGEQEACVMGTSGGAVAALWTAIFAPEQVRSVIADSLTEHHPPERMREEIANRQQLTPEQCGFWRAAHGPDWRQVVEEDNRICLAFAEAGGDWFRGRLKEIRCPVLLSASLTDSLLVQPGLEIAGMAAQIPGSQAFLVHGGDHPLMWSRPREFRAVADAFLAQAAAP